MSRHPMIFKKIANLLLLSVVLGNLMCARTCFAEETAALDTLRATSNAFAEIAKKVSPAVVNIQVEQGQPSSEILTRQFRQEDGENMDPFNDDFFKFFFGQPMPRDNQARRPAVVGQGSGFIIRNDAGTSYIVTNNHVVRDASKISVKLLDGRELEAKIVGADSHSDLAVIKVSDGNLPVLQLGNSDNIQVGEWALAIGNPFGLSNTLTAGIVSAKGRSGVGITDYENFIQTDAAINPGNSGGPLVNIAGEVIGINTAIVSQSGGYMGIGFAIPVNMAVNITDQLVKTGSVSRGYFGVSIQDLTDELAKSFGLKAGTKGILVAQVMPDSPAAKSGIKQGDIIVELDGVAVKSTVDFRNTIALGKLGSNHTIVVLRDNVKKTFKFDISGQPEEKKTLASADSNVEKIEKLGVSVKTLTPSIAGKFGLKDGKGVLVASVTRGSIADMAGIRPNMVILEVNRKPVATAEEFIAAIEKSDNGVLLFLIHGRAGTWYLTIQHK